MRQTVADILMVGARVSPVAGFLLLGFLLFLRLGCKKVIRESVAVAWTLATVATGTTAIAITEFSSACNDLTPGFCRTAWILCDLGLLTALVLMKGAQPQPLRWWRELRSEGGSAAIAMGIGAGLFLIAVGVFSLEMPTTVWDCHTYHMPRIMHWLQQHNVGPYPTNIPRQVDYPPGGEMFTAQLMLLCGDDRPANLPQWWALLTAAVIAAFLTRKLIALTPRRKKLPRPSWCWVGMAFAAILVATTPGAAPEAVTTLGNVLAGACAMAAILLGWLVIEHPENRVYPAGCGAAGAIGLCVKYTTCFYLAPFVALAVILLVVRRHYLSLFRLALISLVLIGALNGRWMWQNYRRLGNPLMAPSIRAANLNPSPTPRKITAAVIRNLSIYLRTPSKALTDDLNTILQLTSDFLRVRLDDRSSSFEGRRFDFQDPSGMGDGSALGNCYTALLLAVAALGFAWSFKVVSPMGGWIAALAASFIFFSAVVRWDPWHGRLEFDYLILASPFIAAALATWFNRWILVAIAAFLLCNATLSLTGEAGLPTLAAASHSQPRESLYFAGQRDLCAPTIRLADDIVKSGCTNVLLKIGADTWEYPFWVLLKDRGFHGSIQHVLCETDSSRAQSNTLLNLPGTVLVSTPFDGLDARFHPIPVSIPKSFPVTIHYGPWNVSYQAGTAHPPGQSDPSLRD